MRVLHLEDSSDKHIEVACVLKKLGIEDITWKKNVSDGMEELITADESDKKYDLVITDMHYPLEKGEKADWDAGERFVEMVKEKQITVPIIMCSSLNYQLPGIYGSIWYSQQQDWEMELQQMVKALMTAIKE